MKRGKRILLIVCVLALILLLCVGGLWLQDSRLEVETDRTADIPAEDGAFAADADTCIALLNEDIAAAGLPLIQKPEQTEHILESGENGQKKKAISYEAEIDSSVTLSLHAFPEEQENRIVAMELIVGPDQNKERIKQGKQYFEILCDNVEPRFNAAEFRGRWVFNNSRRVGNVTFCLLNSHVDGMYCTQYYAAADEEALDFIP